MATPQEAVVDTEVAAPVSVPPGGGPLGQARSKMQEALSRLNNTQKVLGMVGIAAIIALLAGMFLWNKEPAYKVLFSNLSGQDGGAIIASLEQMNIPYQFSEGSGAILVPAARVHDARLRLATQGLPRGGSVGFELLDNQKFGISQFGENVNYQRALEGELARTIQTIATVQGVRVHLAIPKPSVFVREEQKPSASILLTLHPGRSLEASQVAGITHLVASSVPQLPPANVTLLDQNGNMLSKDKDKLDLDPTQLRYVKEIESNIIKRVEDILLPIAGTGNYRVQVAADVDFSHTEQTSEDYRPNVTPPDVVIRSQQTSEQASVSSPPQGVPGALSNQPPVPATAPITNPQVPDPNSTANGPRTTGPGRVDAAGLNAPVLGAGQPLNTRKDQTTNYEVSKKITHIKAALGTVKRLTVAVVVNNRKDVGKDGKAVTRALNETELKQINDLVREAMGYSKDRGDSLSVANAPFSAVEKPEEPPFWKGPEAVELGKELIKYLVVAGALVMIFVLAIRPVLQQMFPPPSRLDEEGDGPGGSGASGAELEMEEELTFDEMALSLATYQQKLDRAKSVAQSDPQIVANVIKDWITPSGG